MIRSSDIPADILATAEAMVEAQYARDLVDPEWEETIDIARAIFAERERCAQIADKVSRQDDLALFVATAIARYIRNPHSLPLSSQATMPGEVVPQPASPGSNSTEQT